ncbi:MAG: nitroreductase family protein [Candidatus Thermoplasmatota archaeon]
MEKKVIRRYCTITIALVFLSLIFTPTFSTTLSNGLTEKDGFKKDVLELSEPLSLNISIEKAICRRRSVREFTGEGINEDELSTILWHAYGFTEKEDRVIHSLTDEYPIKLYVLNENGVFLYEPEIHRLIKYRSFDGTWIGQYDTATVKIALVWDKEKCSNENLAGGEIGEIGQNIYFSCNALDLGTVTTATKVNQLYFTGLPSNEKPLIIMPIGHPKEPYSFRYKSITSDLLSIENSTMSFTEAVTDRSETIAWKNTGLTPRQQTQILWSAYGSSYYIDEINDRRHRTVPSSHGTYPFEIYFANNTGIYRYHGRSHTITEIKKGDFRKEIADSTKEFISNASLIVIPVLNTTDINERYLWAWYYEAAASSYNVMLESTAWNLSSNIIIDTDKEDLNSLFGLKNENKLPVFAVPVGKHRNVDNQPPTITIDQPTEGLYFLGRKITDLENIWIIGPYQAEISSEEEFCFKSMNIYVDDKAIAHTTNQNVSISLPSAFFSFNKELKIKAYDYERKNCVKSLEYFKLI